MADFRKDFPIFSNQDFVYLDSAATTQKPASVIAAITNFYTSENAPRFGMYPLSGSITEKVEEVRGQVARFIHASPEEIIFTSSATEAIKAIASSWGRIQLKKGDRVTTTVMEHQSNFIPWQQLCLEKGAELKILDIREDGTLDIPSTMFHSSYRASEVEFALQTTKLLVMTAVSHVLGTVNPVADILKSVKRKNPRVKMVVDASQAAVHMPIDVKKLECDFLVLSGHKLFAETGIGILYIKRDILDSLHPFLYSAGMVESVTAEKSPVTNGPARFETDTLNLSGIVSLGAALSYIEEQGWEAIQTYERDLLEYSLKHLQKNREITLLGPQDPSKQVGILSFVSEGLSPQSIGQALGERNICVGAGPQAAQPLHKRLKEKETVRVSLSVYNTREDIDRLTQALKQIQKQFA